MLINLNLPLVFGLIEDCKLLLQLLENTLIRQVYREANMVTNFLAKSALNSSNELIILDAPFDGLQLSLMDDFMQHCISRLVNIL